MKKISYFSLIIVFATIGLSAQQSNPFRSYAHNAATMQKAQMRYSLFSFAEYGISDKLTISAHPLWVFMSPDISVRWTLADNGKSKISLTHGISCPTPVLSLVARKGTGGIISPEFDIPFMLSISNGIISSYEINSNHVLTGGLSLEFALLNNSLEPGSTIDLPIISPRNNVFYKNFGIELNIGAEGKLSGKFDYFSKAEIFIFPFQDDEFKAEYGNTNRFFGELTGMAFWNITKKFKLGFGGRLNYGDYPFGTQWHLLPVIDFVKYTR